MEDYLSVKSAGVNFAILKVINKDNAPDPSFYTHMTGLNGVGVPVIGGYTYSYVNTVEKAAKATNAFVRIGAPKGINFMWLDLADISIKGLESILPAGSTVQEGLSLG